MLGAKTEVCGRNESCTVDTVAKRNWEGGRSRGPEVHCEVEVLPTVCRKITTHHTDDVEVHRYWWPLAGELCVRDRECRRRSPCAGLDAAIPPVGPSVVSTRLLQRRGRMGTRRAPVHLVLGCWLAALLVADGRLLCRIPGLHL